MMPFPELPDGAGAGSPTRTEPDVAASIPTQSPGPSKEYDVRVGPEQLLALIDNTSSVIYMRDVTGRYMLVNSGYEQLFKIRRRDIVGLTDHDLFPGETADAFRANDLAAISSAVPVQVEEDVPGDDGMNTYLTVKFRLVDALGIPYAICGISTDITARKRAEEEVRLLNLQLEQRVRERTAELESSTQELDAFAYSVSHDLRAPLRSLHGYSQILIEEYSAQLDEGAQGYLHRLQANAVKMAQLIDDLLRLSRTTRIQLHRERVDLTKIFRTVVAELREADPDRTTEIEVDDHLETDGDGSLLQLAVHNLLANAWKFTATTPDARIVVGSSMQDGERVFSIRDNGVGFDPSYADKLFQPFQRLHSRETFGGSGIGLAIVFRVIQRHGGRVWAQSAPGEGATFFFTVTPAPVQGHDPTLRK